MASTWVCLSSPFRLNMFSEALYDKVSYFPEGTIQVRRATMAAIISKMVCAVGNFSFFNRLKFFKNKDSINLELFFN